MRARIAIPVPTSGDLGYNRLNWQAYADCVAAVGGEPVEFGLELSRREWQALAAGCQGICLPGSPADVDPERYGQEREEACAEADGAREALDFLLLEHAAGVGKDRAGKPLLAICFGAQMLNVWRGGTLVQDLAPMPVNHAAGRAVMTAHSVMVAEESFLATLVDAQEAEEVDGYLRVGVNSSHHQAIGIPGAGLRAVARCPQDGVIEAVEQDDEAHGFLVGVQWHPERTFANSATSRRIFERFVEQAGAWRADVPDGVTAAAQAR